MHTKEILVENYMQALLKASLLLGNPHKHEPIHKVAISGFQYGSYARTLHSQCIIICEPNVTLPELTSASSSATEVDYLILYPLSRLSEEYGNVKGEE